MILEGSKRKLRIEATDLISVSSIPTSVTLCKVGRVLDQYLGSQTTRVLPWSRRSRVPLSLTKV